MRVTFAQTLLNEAKKNKRIFLLTGDLGFSVFEDFIKYRPQQYVNMGIAEANMTGVAAGLATEGKIPFIYSIIPFITMRNFEQIRNDVCYQNLNVKIIGVGAGFSYGPYGHTHHALEDIGILRTLPNLTIFSPADSLETYFSVQKALSIKGPVYIRLSRENKLIHKSKISPSIKKGAIIKKGKDGVIFATGSMVDTALQTSALLERNKIELEIVSMLKLKPIDNKQIIEYVKRGKAIFTIEEHFKTGGLGSIISEIIAESGYRVVFKRFAIPDRFTKFVGKREDLLKESGLNEQEIEKTILSCMDR